MLMESVQVSDSADGQAGVAARTEKWIRKQRWFILFVILPVLFSAAYYGLFASDIYVSEARFVIKSPDQKRSQSTTLASIIQTTGLSAGQEQTNEVLDYVRSRDALRDLSKRMDVRAKYMRSEADWGSRYPTGWQDDTFENLYKFYGKMVSAKLDHDTGAAVLTVKGFTPGDAHDIGEGLLGLSENLVNRLNARAQKTQVAEAEGRVQEAERRIKAARIAMRQYRNDERVLDPAKEAGGVLEVSTGLIAQRAMLVAQLQSMIAGAPRNPAIPALRSQVAAIDAQITAQTGRAAGTTSGLASKMTDYEGLLVEQEFATKMLTTTAASLEQARADAMQQQFYLERIVEPNLPDMALLPQRLFQVLSVAGVALCLYLVGWMLIVGILEHRPDE
jgi:capsular polysaccharide transport system permease protein